MIRLIAAIDTQRGIGKNGGQPWSIPLDEAYFARCTKSHGAQILVGRTTFETFEAPLPDRTNYVLTSRQEPLAGAELVHDLENFLQAFADKDLWVVGGAKLFQAVIDLSQADELYLTHIDAGFNCDRFFPEYKDQFEPTSEGESQHQNGFTFRYNTYKRAA